MAVKIAVGTESALKLRATKAAFEAFRYPDLEILSCKADSGVGIQPVGLEEMARGAENRARAARAAHTEASFSIGIENGLVQQGDWWYDPTCVVVFNDMGNMSRAYGAFFPIPDSMAIHVLNEHTELGEVVKQYAGGGEKDPMKYLSNNMIHREQLLAQAIQCALNPLLNFLHYSE